MEHNEIINQTISFVKTELAGAEGGHDWFHINRVYNNAKNIAQFENVNLLVVELGALLHDIADSKFHNGDEEIGPKKAREFLESLNLEKEIITHVENIVRHISFSGGNHKRGFDSIEMDVVQDADKLDAIGAIGIGRTFTYGGHKNREMYNPEINPKLDMTKDEYKNNNSPSVNHFYEKLLLLKDTMNTETGTKIAQNRHKFMEKYLEQFYKEWNGEL